MGFYLPFKACHPRLPSFASVWCWLAAWHGILSISIYSDMFLLDNGHPPRPIWYCGARRNEMIATRVPCHQFLQDLPSTKLCASVAYKVSDMELIDDFL
uniref:Putative secreted protein n=1 Tax=Anopheles darlingi TaxID=43151 RepID=A0A2M4DIV0_ANODA